MYTPEATDLGGRGEGAGYGYTQKRLHVFYWVFIGTFSSQTKVPPFKAVFHLANSFDLTNISVQAILFPLNLVLRASLTFFGMESKRSTLMLILLILTLYGTFDISLQ